MGAWEQPFLFGLGPVVEFMQSRCENFSKVGLPLGLYMVCGFVQRSIFESIQIFGFSVVGASSESETHILPLV